MDRTAESMAQAVSGDELDTVLSRINPDRLIDLLISSVEQYSPPFAEEPAMEVFAQALTDAGIPFVRQAVPGRPNDGQPGNLLIELGPRPAQLMWVGHVDTVPLFEEEQLTPEFENGVLHGLGAADMKSGCAAIIEALTAFAEAGLQPKRGLAVALVVGEEEYGDGSEALLEKLRAPLTVIGEPTGLVPCIDHYGYYEYRLAVQGSRAHAALPEHGASAIHGMLSWITAIYEDTQEGAETPPIAVNPRGIQGGSNLFMVAQDCEAMLDIHAAPGTGAGEVAALVARAEERAAATHDGCRFEAECIYEAEGYRAAQDDPRLNPLRTAFEGESGPGGWSPNVFRSHSDANMFHAAGSLPVVCGPGQLEVAHTRHEHVSVAETISAARLYARMIWQACYA